MHQPPSVTSSGPSAGSIPGLQKEVSDPSKGGAMSHRHARPRVPVRVRVRARVASRIDAIGRRRAVLSGLVALALVPVLLGVHVVSAAFTAATANSGNAWQATNISAG